MAEPYLKTARAEEHLDDLRERFRKFREDQPIRITREDDLKNQRHIVRLHVKPIPDVFPLIVGDFLYCVRSSLDQLVWHLAKATFDYPRGTQFPIFETEDPDRFRKFTNGVPAGAITIIDELQPYKRGDPVAIKSHLLWRLNLLCNIDKHRRIPTDKNVTGINFPSFPKVSVPLIDYDAEAGVIKVPLHLKDKMAFEPTASLNVIFGDSTEGIECDIGGLEEIYEYVTTRVLPRFLSFF